jgi:hypothetical protein
MSEPAELSEADHADIKHDVALVHQYGAGEITKDELINRSRWFGRIGHPTYEQEVATLDALSGGDFTAMLQSAVQGALAEIGHRPFTMDEIVDDAKAAIGLEDE